MDRRTAESILLAALAVVALAAAAATLPSATTSGGSGGGVPGGGEGDPGALPTPAPETGSPLDLSFLRPLLIALFLIAVVVLIVYAFLYRREAFRLLVGLLAVVAVLALLAWLLSTLDPAEAFGGGFDGLPVGEEGGSDGEESPAAPPLLLLAIAGIVALVAVAVLLRSGPSLADGAVREEGPGAEEVAAVGRAAGRAADRIESTDDLDNEIYRAWREMTGLLEVDRPKSTSPGEFAAAATDAGMDPDDVGELTRLFEDVRYGGDEPTTTTERRALAILRRVEDAYVPAGGDGG